MNQCVGKAHFLIGPIEAWTSTTKIKKIIIINIIRTLATSSDKG